MNEDVTIANPDVTVVTVVFNALKGAGEEALKACLDSVQAQRGVALEHIVVDGGSTDGTAELVRDFKAGEVPYRWVSERDNGIYHAMNKGLGLAKGRYITFLNSDDFYCDPFGLRDSVAALDAKKTDFSYAPAVIIDRAGVHVADHPHNAPDLRRTMYGIPFSHQSMLVRTDLMKRMGGFDVTYERSADYAFLVALLFSGRRAVRVDRAFVKFRTGGISSHDFAKNNAEHAIAFERFAKRFLGGPLPKEQLEIYFYACILRTFGPDALPMGWKHVERHIASHIAEKHIETNRLHIEINALKAEISTLKNENKVLKTGINALKVEIKGLGSSAAYRTGMVVTWPARMIWRILKSFRHKR